MANKSGAPAYPLVAIAIHWLVAACVLGLIPVGLLMSRLDEGPVQERLFFVHQSIGVLVLALTILRLTMRAVGKMPEPAAVLTPFERVASRMTHFSLYVLLLITPLVGWLGVNAYGEDVSFFGLFRLPAILVKDEELSDQIFALHLACGILITLATLAHVTGALVHKMRDDGVMERILPRR